VVVALGVAAYQAIRWAEGPAIPTEEHPPSKAFVIPDGSTFQFVASLLEREGLIKSSSVFVLFGKSQSADRKVHAGEYELNPGMTPAEILSKLLNGQVLLHPLTIPEGSPSPKSPIWPRNRASRIARSFSGLRKTGSSLRHLGSRRRRWKGISIRHV